MKNSTERNLEPLLKDLGREAPGLQIDNQFVYWFLLAGIYNPNDAPRARDSVCGAKGDGGFDAVAFDDAKKIVFLIQSKYRKKHGTAEKKAELDKLINDTNLALDSSRDAAKEAFVASNLQARALLQKAWRRVYEGRYRARIVFLTTGRLSPIATSRAQADVRQLFRSRKIDVKLDVEDYPRVAKLLKLYLEGAAPPTPTIQLALERGTQLLRREDSSEGATSWVFSTTAISLSNAFEVADVRLFDKNIRGFLGNTKINKEIVKTIRHRPRDFFYFNNGVTIISDNVMPLKDAVEIERPQVINGQQTVRTLSEHPTKKEINVLVKVIELSSTKSERASEDFISQVVAGTNWQNTISFADLRANDHVQIQLERALYSLQYLYLRKRQAKGEAVKLFGLTFKSISKEYIAKAVAACDLDPWEVRSGVANLFERHYHALFRTIDPYFYLVRFWLLKAVEKRSRGRAGDRQYAKWMVTWFVWRQIGPLLASNANRRTFVDLMSTGRGDIRPLDQLIESVFVAARAYYISTRWKRSIDPSRFYRDRKNHHKNFGQFWAGYPRRKKMNLPARLRELGALLTA